MSEGWCVGGLVKAHILKVEFTLLSSLFSLLFSSLLSSLASLPRTDTMMSLRVATLSLSKTSDIHHGRPSTPSTLSTLSTQSTTRRVPRTHAIHPRNGTEGASVRSTFTPKSYYYNAADSAPSLQHQCSSR
jgi:hypothetical protein